MNEEQHKAFIYEQKELFRKEMTDTFYDLTDHPMISYDFQSEKTNERWLGWLDHAFKTLKLENDCMIGQTWFMKGTPVSALIKYAEEIYKAEVIAQNSKIKFGTDDNENWFAHDVPFFGTVQILNEFNEWDIHFGDCWQGPFNSKSECIKHLEECIQEKKEELAQGENN